MVRKLNRSRPEEIIQDAIRDYLVLRGWYVMRMHGNMYQKGVPDLYATHSKHGGRWIEVKLPNMKGSRFTPAQMECFPKLRANGTNIWILTGATEQQYALLFNPCNIDFYLMNAL